MSFRRDFNSQFQQLFFLKRTLRRASADAGPFRHAMYLSYCWLYITKVPYCNISFLPRLLTVRAPIFGCRRVKFHFCFFCFFSIRFHSITFNIPILVVRFELMFALPSAFFLFQFPSIHPNLWPLPPPQKSYPMKSASQSPLTRLT